MNPIEQTEDEIDAIAQGGKVERCILAVAFDDIWEEAGLRRWVGTVLDFIVNELNAEHA